MPFKVKDLLVDVTSVVNTIQQCHPTYMCKFGCSILAFSGCYHVCSHLPSYCHLGCTFALPSICPQGTQVTCGPTFIWQTETLVQQTPQLRGPVLSSFKENLRLALEVAERQSAAENEALKPQTAAEVEMLETKLGEALEDLRARKVDPNKKK